MKHTQAIWIIILSLVLPQIASAALYSWRDKDGNMHFSDTPPNGRESKTLQAPEPVDPDAPRVVRQSAPKPPPKPATEESVEKPKEETPKVAVLSDDEKRKACEDAKKNVQVLARVGLVRTKDKDGGTKILSEAEKQEKMENSKKVVETYCEK